MACRARATGGWRVMRKSRVVNLGDNILCETFLFLVQRELQRQQGRTTHSRYLPTPTPRQGRQAGRQIGVAASAEGCCGCQSHGKWRVQCARCFWPVQKQRQRQKKQQLWPVTCATSPSLLPHPLHKVCGCGCVCCCCCGGAAVATFYCFCCIAKQQRRTGGGRGGVGVLGSDGRGLGAARFEEFMAFRDVSMCVWQASERAMRLDTMKAATASPIAKIGNLPQAPQASHSNNKVLTAILAPLGTSGRVLSHSSPFPRRHWSQRKPCQVRSPTNNSNATIVKGDE